MPTTLLRKSSALSTHAAADTRVPAPLTRKASGRVLGQASQPTIASPTDALLSPVSRAIKRRVRKVPIVREKVGPTLPALHLPIVLGSSSAVRAAVLERHGVTFTVAAADIDEKAIRHADAKTMTVLIARAKAQALQGRLTSPCILVTADQVRGDCIYRVHNRLTLQLCHVSAKPHANPLSVVCRSSSRPMVAYVKSL